MGFIFISGANITIGGPLEIYRNVLNTLSANYSNRKVVALVSDKNLFPEYKNVNYIEFRNYKRFIFLKFYFEYFKFYFLSKKYKIDLWLSLNDCSPTVKAKTRAVYCHNATPFLKRTFNDYLMPNRVFFQSFYYIFFYKINLKHNTYIIVQQKWMKDFFMSRLKIAKSNIIVNRPDYKKSITKSEEITNSPNIYTFIYPTKAETYKNIEVILEAVILLNNRGIFNFRIILTLSKDENRYSRYLYSKYKHLSVVEWVGFVSRIKLNELYEHSDCLIFSSKLETWGLPISEFKSYNKPMLLSDLPYAHETADDYGFCKFFDPDNSNQLSVFIEQLISGNKFEFDLNRYTNCEMISTFGFNELFNLLLRNDSSLPPLFSNVS